MTLHSLKWIEQFENNLWKWIIFWKFPMRCCLPTPTCQLYHLTEDLFFTPKKGEQMGERTEAQKCVCQPLKGGIWLAERERPTILLWPLTSVCPLAINPILIYSLTFPTRTWTALKLGSSSVSRPTEPACPLSGPLAYLLITGFHCNSLPPDTYTGQVYSSRTFLHSEHLAWPWSSLCWLPAVF